MSELKAYIGPAPDEKGLADYYLKSEADKVIKSITEGAISMFRDSSRCRGFDLESPLGKIADAAYKHWMRVDITQDKNKQLKEENDRLLLNNSQLLDRIVQLEKHVIAQEREIRRHEYKRCLAMAEWCNSEMGRETFACFIPRSTKEVWREEHKYWAKWRKIWFNLAKKFKEAK